MLEPQIVFRLQLPSHQQQAQWQLQGHLRDRCKLECKQQLVLFQEVMVEVLDRGFIGELDPSWDINCSKIMETTNMPDESGTWYVEQLVLLSFIAHLTQGEAVDRKPWEDRDTRGTKGTSACCPFSHLLEFPTSFSASSKAKVSHSYLVHDCIKILSRLRLPVWPLRYSKIWKSS